MWPKVRLGDACVKIGSGATPRGGAQVYVDSGISLIRSQNIYNGRFKYDGLTYITDDAASKLRNVTVCSGDVLLNITGDSVARCALVPENVLPARVNQHVSILRTNSSVLLPAYLQAALTEPFMQAYMIGLASGQGGSRNALTKRNIESFEIVLPPLPIQQKIADILGAYDDLIENNRRRIELLEKMARELYRERFVRRRGEGAELTLLEVFDFVRGKSYASNEIDVVEGVPMVNLKNIRAWGGYNSGAERLFSGDFKEEQTLGRGDVIMGVTDMTQDRRIVGHVALVPTLDQTATFSMDIIKLIPKDMSNVELYSILQYSGVSQAISQLATGATVLHLRPGALDSVRLWIPRKSDFEKVEELFSGYYSEIDNLILQNRNLAKQRDRLLPRLMSGKLDVSKLVKEGV